jgi:hypothetical protein
MITIATDFLGWSFALLAEPPSLTIGFLNLRGHRRSIRRLSMNWIRHRCLLHPESLFDRPAFGIFS